MLPHLSEWTRGDAAKVIKAFCRSLKITDIRFDDLRATFITNLLSRGKSLARVVAIVGYADMETTNVYSRKSGIERKDGTEKLGYKIPSVESVIFLNLVRNIPATLRSCFSLLHTFIRESEDTRKFGKIRAIRSITHSLRQSIFNLF